MLRRLLVLLLIVLPPLSAGCMTYADRVQQVRTAFYAGDLATAQRLVEEGLERESPNRDVLRLENAMIQLAAGRPDEAERTLREVRDRFDYLEQKSLAEGTLALLADDDQLAYPGEDYEKVLVRAMLALANLVQDGSDAEAYSLQIVDKQQQIIQAAVDSEGNNPKAAYQQVALGPYLRAALREQTHRDYDDAARQWALVASWQPGLASVREHIERAERGVHSQRGNGVLYVFALVGRGPYKEEVAEMPTTAALLIADRILSNQLQQELPPTIAPIKIPRLVACSNAVAGLEVTADGTLCGHTETVTDVTQMALLQHEAVLPQIMARAVIRRVVKKGMIYGAKEALGVERGSLESLPFELLGIAWEATENADTRCWGLLPDKIQALRVELPAGGHEITLRPIGHRGTIRSAGHTQRVTIADGRNTYLLVQVPDGNIIGQTLVGTP